jgi:hypothetical protein
MNAIMGIADLLAKTPLSAEQNNYVQIFRRAGDNLLHPRKRHPRPVQGRSLAARAGAHRFSLRDLLDKVRKEMVAVRAHEKGPLACAARSPGTCLTISSATRRGCGRYC